MNTTMTCRGLAGVVLFSLLATLFVLPEQVLAATTDNASVTVVVEHFFWVRLCEEGGEGYAGEDHDSQVLHDLSNTPFELGLSDLQYAEAHGGFSEETTHGWLHGWGNGQGSQFTISVAMTDDEFHDYGIQLWARLGDNNLYLRQITTTMTPWWGASDPHAARQIHWKLGGLSTSTPATPEDEELMETVTVSIAAG